MSYDFSVDRKKIILVFTISLVLAVSIFMAGWMIGIMAKISRITGHEIKPGDQKGLAVATPASTPPAAPKKQITDTPQMEADQEIQKPETAASSQAAGESKASISKVRMPITKKPQPQKAQPVAEKTPEKTAGTPLQKRAFTVQVESCIVMQNAVKTANQLKNKGYEVFILKKQGPRGKTWYAVQIGSYEDRKKASQAASEFSEKEKIVAVVMPIASHLLQLRKSPSSFVKPEDEQSGGAAEEAQSGSTPKDAQSELKPYRINKPLQLPPPFFHS